MDRQRLKLVPPQTPMTLDHPSDGLHFGNALDDAPFPCLRLDASGVIHAANRAMGQLLGLSMGRRAKPVLSAYVAPAELTSFFGFLRKIHGTTSPHRVLLRMRKPGAPERVVQLEGQRLTHEDDQALVSLCDVTEREDALASVRESEARMRALLETLPDAVFVITGGAVVAANPAAQQFVGCDPVGLDFAGFVCAEQRSLVTARTANNHMRGTERHELRFRDQQDNTLSTETIWLPVVFDGDAAILCVARDHTSQRELEATLAHNERIATVGVLAAGVAHELNNPLTYIGFNLDEILDHLSGLDALEGKSIDHIRSAAQEAQEGASRMARIVADLRSIVRVKEELGPVDLNAVVRTALKLVGAHTCGHVEVETSLGHVERVRGEQGRLTQVILNLVLNAIQAMPNVGGRVLISTAMTRAGVTLTIRDNGPGIPAAIRDRIFEPFVTTKEVGKGTGLGLFVCHRYVSECDGRIEVSAVEQGGTAFTITLQPERGATAEALPEDDARPVPLPRRRFLIVDDQPELRRLLSRRLSALGEVSVAANAVEAISMIRDSDRFDAILCDMLMPGGNGRVLYEHLSTTQPELLATLGFMTGGVVTEQDREFLRREDPPLLSKPFAPAELVEFLEERIAAGDDDRILYEAQAELR